MRGNDTMSMDESSDYQTGEDVYLDVLVDVPRGDGGGLPDVEAAQIRTTIERGGRDRVDCEAFGRVRCHSVTYVHREAGDVPVFDSDTPMKDVVAELRESRV